VYADSIDYCMRHKPVKFQNIEIEYDSIHGDTWEKRNFAEGDLRQDLMHVCEYEISQYSLDPETRIVKFLIQVPADFEISKDMFPRANRVHVQE
jgi:hypothetical protein